MTITKEVLLAQAEVLDEYRKEFCEPSGLHWAWLGNKAAELRTRASSLTESGAVPVASEHDAAIIRDLEAMAANVDNGFWPSALAIGALRLIRTHPAPASEPAGGRDAVLEECIAACHTQGDGDYPQFYRMACMDCADTIRALKSKPAMQDNQPTILERMEKIREETTASGLLTRSMRQLIAWQETYGEHQPGWLPPAGDVRLMEDIAEFQAAPAIPAVAQEGITPGISRAAWHDKAWALFHSKTFDDPALQKLSIHTLRTVFNATYDALALPAPVPGGEK